MVEETASARDLLSIPSEHRLRSENLPFDIDVWYPRLAQFTPRTRCIALTRTEACAVLAYQEHRFNQRRQRFNTDHVRVLQALEARLNQIICENFPKGAFMRLCGRSPKDAEPYRREDVRQRYAKALQLLVDGGAPADDAMTKLRAAAKVNYLGVYDGKDAMSLLLTSERVFTDLHDWIKWGEPDQVVLRTWEPELTIEGFIFKGKLNAISQYDHYAIYPDLVGMKDMIQEKIFALWKEAHPHVGVESYVMDFAYLPQSDKMIVVEISPFLNCTGPALFKWDKDEEVMKRGPVEFRLNTYRRPHLDEIVESNWVDRWLQDVPDYDSFYSKANQVEPAAGVISQFWKKLTTSEGRHLLFVYGTLRAGYHWNSKFLSTSRLVCAAITDACYPLVVGQSYVPYLLGDLPDVGHRIVGEVWEVDDVTLQNLDEYEGIGKGYYSRREIGVTAKEGGKQYVASVYFKTESESTPELRKAPLLSEYTLEMHRAHYNPIMHIMVKQQLYMGDINWGEFNS